jgi:hypothetical protein
MHTRGGTQPQPQQQRYRSHTLGLLDATSSDIGDMQLPKQNTTPTSALSENGDHLKRREGPVTLRLDTRATKRPRTEAHRSVHPQQNLPPTPDLTPSSTRSIITSPITNDQFQMPTSATINTAMDRKRPRSADMCGQFEDIVGAVPPPRQRSSQPLSQPLPAPTVVGDTAFFDFNRYEQERTIQCQHPIPTHTFTSLSMTIGDTNQSITSSQQRDEDTAPYFLDLDMDLDTSGFPALDPYSPDLNICMNTSGFLA